MNIQTLILTHEALVRRGIREAARSLGCAPSTLSAALARFEAAAALPLARREAGGFLLTLEAELHEPVLRAVREAAEEMLRLAGRPQTPIPAISLDMLRRFSAAARHGSLRSAGRALGIGQPQLTRQIGALEEKLGAELFERTPSGVRLTAPGRRILPYAEAVVMGWERIADSSSLRFRRREKAWRLGAIWPMGHESSIARMLADCVALWTERRPQRPLFVSNHGAEELILGLKTRRFDLALIDHLRIPQEFDHMLLFESRLALVGDPFALPEEGDLAEILKRLPVALPNPGAGLHQEAMRYLERILGPEEARRAALVEMDSMPVIINLVARHGHLSVLPETSLRRLPFALRRIPLGPEHRQRLTMAWRREDPPHRLIEAMQEAAERERAARG